MKYKGNINLMLQKGESAVVPKGEMWKLTLYARDAGHNVSAIIGTNKGVTEVSMTLGLPISINLGSGAKLGINSYGTGMFFAQGVAFTE